MPEIVAGANVPVKHLGHKIMAPLALALPPITIGAAAWIIGFVSVVASPVRQDW
jgi:hypothetical protein